MHSRPPATPMPLTDTELSILSFGNQRVASSLRFSPENVLSGASNYDFEHTFFSSSHFPCRESHDHVHSCSGASIVGHTAYSQVDESA